MGLSLPSHIYAHLWTHVFLLTALANLSALWFDAVWDRLPACSHWGGIPFFWGTNTMSIENSIAHRGTFSVLIRVLLGLVFLASTLAKTVDFANFVEHVSYYGVVEENMYLEGIAAVTIALEFILAVALLSGWRTRFILAVTAGVLMVFTALIAYAWTFNDLAECGCFGSFLSMTPAVSIGKNLVLLLLLPFAWPRPPLSASGPTAQQAPVARGRRRAWVFAAGCTVGILLALALEIGAYVVYVTFFHDHMIGNLEKRALAPSPPGTPMSYDWQVRDKTGKIIDMAAFEGRPLFLAFFSGSCPKCEAQLPSLERFYTAIKGDEIGFLAISTGEKEKIDAMLERQGCTFPVHTIAKERPPLFKRLQVPSGYVFSKEGELLYEQFDAARWDNPEFVAFLKGLAAPQKQ